jgi:hypothetical protein
MGITVSIDYYVVMNELAGGGAMLTLYSSPACLLYCGEFKFKSGPQSQFHC